MSRSCDIIIPVWGNLYIDTFLEFSLSALCAPGNLDGKAIPEIEIAIRIYTDREGQKHIEKHPLITTLQRCYTVSIESPASINFSSSKNYSIFNSCYLLGMQQAFANGSAVILLTADQIWSQGSLTAILYRVRKGAQAVMVGGLRVLDTDFIRHCSQENLSLGIQGKKLVQLALENLHPWDRTLVHDENNKVQPGSFHFWNVPGQGMLARCLHLHPVYINLRYPPAQLPRTVDADNLVAKQCPDMTKIHIITDSDESMHVSLAPRAQSAHLLDYPRGDWQEMKNWALTMGITRHNLYYFNRDISFHTCEMDKKLWHEAELQANSFCSPVLTALNKPHCFLFSKILFLARNCTWIKKIPFVYNTYLFFKNFFRLAY